MDGLGGLHAKWNKSEKDILYHITYMWDIINIQQDGEYNKIEADSQIERTK